MAFREGKEMSDDDVSSLLDDLASLGLLEEDEVPLEQRWALVNDGE